MHSGHRRLPQWSTAGSCYRCYISCYYIQCICLLYTMYLSFTYNLFVLKCLCSCSWCIIARKLKLQENPVAQFVCPALGQGWEGVRSGELFGQDHFPFLGWWYPSSKATIRRPPHCSAMLGHRQFPWSNVLLRQITFTMYSVHSETKILFPVLHTAACSSRTFRS